MPRGKKNVAPIEGVPSSTATQSMESGKIYVRIFFTESILGTWPADPEIARNFVASKSPNAKTLEEEIASVGVDEVIEKSITVFNKTATGEPHHWDFQWRGFLKAAWAACKKIPGSVSSDIRAGKKMVDTVIFVFPRKVKINFNGEIDYCERPLRASTPKGERVSLANSEQIPAGAWSEIMIECLTPSDINFVREALNYGRYSGMGQWRNSGKGRFLWQELTGFGGDVIGGNFGEYYPSIEDFKEEHPGCSFGD